MTPWWLLMLGGLLGSSHCVGMCGGFAAIVGLNTGTLARNFRAQLIFSAGRLATYAAFGAIAGFAGKRLMDSVPGIVNVPAVLCILSGLFLLYQGLKASGIWSRGVAGTSAGGCLFGPLFSSILRTPGFRNIFIAGVATGLLPCGLVYGFVSLAASTGDLLLGMGTMIAFGMGTIPLMLVTGCAPMLVTWTARQRLWRLAAWSVVLTGSLTLVRGAAFLRVHDTSKPAMCPFCTDGTACTADNRLSSHHAQ